MIFVLVGGGLLTLVRVLLRGVRRRRTSPDVAVPVPFALVDDDRWSRDPFTGARDRGGF